MCFLSWIRLILRNMADHVYDWLLDKSIGWIPAPPQNKIDTHHHFVPDFYAKGKNSVTSLCSSDLLICFIAVEAAGGNTRHSIK
jgi:hypothetical protein